MAEDLNSVTLVGRLTKDPELLTTQGGTSILRIRLAVNGRKKDESGTWVDTPNFFDVSVFGNRADGIAPHLAKGKRIGVNGRLVWREWDATDGSGKRQAVQINAYSVQFLDAPKDGGGGGQGYDAPPVEDFVPSGAAADDDIPF